MPLVATLEVARFRLRVIQVLHSSLPSLKQGAPVTPTSSSMLEGLACMKEARTKQSESLGRTSYASHSSPIAVHYVPCSSANEWIPSVGMILPWRRPFDRYLDDAVGKGCWKGLQEVTPYWNLAQGFVHPRNPRAPQLQGPCPIPASTTDVPPQ